MNNNRQPNNNNNRRRGRSNNNGRPQGNNNANNRSGFDYQNRIDNRARGNASQMLEKYKKLASDAQQNDDRVNAEYYLQFADHYFRVLADFRGRQESRQEERRPQREDMRDDSRDDARDDAQDENGGMHDTSGVDYQNENTAQESTNIQDAPQSQERGPRAERQERSPRRERTQRPRRHHSEVARDDARDTQEIGLDLAVLPPSISLAPAGDDNAADAKPVRKPRARKPKTVNASDVAPAAE